MRASLIFSTLLVVITAIPIPQGAGVGQACDAIWSDSDTTVGDLVNSEGEMIGGDLGGPTSGSASGSGSGSAPPPPPAKGGPAPPKPHRKRQGAGVGAGCDSVFSDSDTTVGDFVESEGQQIGNDMKKPTKRQGNGIGYGVADVIQALPGGQDLANEEGSVVNNIDGEGTQGSADLGEAVGQFELSAGQSVETLTGANDAYSQGGAHQSRKRQGNGIGYGIADIVQALPGGQSIANEEGSEVNTLDGEGTQGSANVGEQIGNTELSAGQTIEGLTGAPDAYSQGGAHQS